MPTILASTLINDALTTLQDPGATRWARSDLLGYLNDAQREIVIAKPDAYVVNGPFQLVAGAKQTLPDACAVLLRVGPNIITGAAGRTPRHVPIKTLDNEIPNWRGDIAANVVLHVATSDDEPKTLYVWPPQPAIGPSSLEIVYSAAPPPVAAETNAITLDDIWKPALYNYMLYRAYSIESEYANEDGPAMACYKIFAALVGLRDKAQEEEKAER